MKPEKVFIGDIRKCTDYRMEPMLICEDSFGITTFGSQSYESEIHKKREVLIQIANSAYIPLSEINSFLSYLAALNDYRINGLNSNRFLYCGTPYRVGQLFVEDESLQPYYGEDAPKRDISIRSLKQQLRNK